MPEAEQGMNVARIAGFRAGLPYTVAAVASFSQGGNMTMTQTSHPSLKGASFLLEDHPAEVTITPEDFTEEQRMIAHTTQAFMEKEVFPHSEEIEHQNFELVVELLRRAGQLGLLSVEIPETYGGMGLSKVSALIVSEKIGMHSSFSVTFGGHSGIGTAPIVMFGTPEQKQKYLPRLASAELISAYALTEPEAGSDALAGKTRADLSPDGASYILNGSKMWITNAGFADIFVTFAKVGGEKFSAFIVPRTTPGLIIGNEEKKMGIKGSSTRALTFENALVPAQNLLGEIGKGHKIAFNVLNLGRLKLAASCLGGGKLALREAAQYARQRHQFGRPISEFGLIQQKLAEMALRLWIGESMVYRTAGLIDHALAGLAADDQVARMKAVEEYAIECAINKVMVSEFLHYVVDEALQIFGGNGYSQEYPVERYYRDARINRIFEGTNEINRLLITEMLMRRARAGHLPLGEAMEKLAREIESPVLPRPDETSPLAEEKRLLAQAKKAVLLVAGAVLERYSANLAEEQELVGALSDMIMEVFAVESGLLRADKLIVRQGVEAAHLPIASIRTYTTEALVKIETLAESVLAACDEGSQLSRRLTAVRRLLRFVPADTVAARRRIAAAVVEAGRYPLGE
jgi:alkylation response protein AidB-like acyl-CoA dehydrogenase